MNPYFVKQDAPSCLVVDATWDSVINKPDDFDEIVQTILEMIAQAEARGLVLNTTTFGAFKEAINDILIRPLANRHETTPDEDDNTEKSQGYVLADAFWDELILSEDWQDFQKAVERAYAMKLQIEKSSPLTKNNTLQETKDNFNETIIKPLIDRVD